MPFTLAHPIAVLPFSRCRYCHFPALVIGSLSPDFVYFLHGRAVSGGHGLVDMLWPNLPLCFAVYWLYLALWRDALSDFLPNCLNAAPYRSSENVDFHKIKAALFIPSALFGMATHLFLDAFTHSTGWFVQHFPVLQRTVLFLPIFKWLQYGSGLIRQILEHCQRFPNHLNLEQQGLFAIGYYHETQFLFTKDALKNLFNEAKTA